MNHCDNGHDPIWFETHHCPMCFLQIEYNKQIKTIEDLKGRTKLKHSKEDKEQIKVLKQQIQVYKDRMREIKNITRRR